MVINAFALAGRFVIGGLFPQGAALGYVLLPRWGVLVMTVFLSTFNLALLAQRIPCYLEFQQGQYHDKCWLDTSISISDEVWNSRHVSDLILEVIPEFDFYGITIVTKVQWDNILTKSQSDGCTCKEIIAEAVPWAAKCFETNDVFTIIGM